jgi:hypothetical protein
MRFGPTCVQTVGAAFDLRVANLVLYGSKPASALPFPITQLMMTVSSLRANARDESSGSSLDTAPNYISPRIRGASVWPNGSAMSSVRMPKASRQC